MSVQVHAGLYIRMLAQASVYRHKNKLVVCVIRRSE